MPVKNAGIFCFKQELFLQKNTFYTNTTKQQFDFIYFLLFFYIFQKNAFYPFYFIFFFAILPISCV